MWHATHAYNFLLGRSRGFHDSRLFRNRTDISQSGRYARPWGEMGLYPFRGRDDNETPCITRVPPLSLAICLLQRSHLRAGNGRICLSLAPFRLHGKWLVVRVTLYPTPERVQGAIAVSTRSRSLPSADSGRTLRSPGFMAIVNSAT